MSKTLEGAFYEIKFNQIRILFLYSQSKHGHTGGGAAVIKKGGEIENPKSSPLSHACYS